MNRVQLADVKDFWNSESCGERYAHGDTAYEQYISETENRYKLSPYLRDFIEFENFLNKDVLEIGVGMGSDHSQIALSKPRSLTGVDLTERAVEHTKNRFSMLGLESTLSTDNAENLSFGDETFDAIYSWGVLHHSPNTKKCFDEVYRVLKPNGLAKIMIYHKYAPVGLLLWVRYGLLRLKPGVGFSEIYANHLESPGTKAYTVKEAKQLAHRFSQVVCSVQLSFGDLLEGDVGARYSGIILKLAKFIYPRPLIRYLSKMFPIGLYLLITVEK